MAANQRKHRDELGPDSAGQSGDIEQLPDTADAGSESVEELIEEGNAYEAEVLDGVENAADDSAAPLRPREVPEDDVPAEYRNDQNRDV